MLEIMVGTMIFVIFFTVLVGAFSKSILKKKKGGNYLKAAVKINMGLMAGLMLAAIVLMFSGTAFASSEAEPESNPTVNAGEVNQDSSDSSAGMAYIAAALSTGLATIGAGIAVAVAGSAALGAISEDSKLLGKTLIFVGLAEGIAIYGLIISIMILNKV